MEHNIATMCRVCLENVDHNCRELFSDQSDSKNILSKFFMCFQIKIEPDEHLPFLICYNCVKELDNAYNLRLKCVSVKERLEELFSLSQDRLEKKARGPTLDLKEKNSDDVGLVSEAEVSRELETTNTMLYQCKICKRILRTQISLTKHMDIMHTNRKHVGKVTGYGSTRKYHCTKCTYSTPHSQTLVNHIRRHNGEKPYHCNCGKSFTQASTLAAHKKIHSDETFYTCTVCGKQFKLAFALKNHLNVHKEGYHMCLICKRMLKSSRTLQDHMHRHYNIRNFSCEECGNTFVTSSELLNHSKKHDVKKNVECHLCGYKTHRKKNLVIHLKRHAGAKDVKCEMCSLTFYTQGDLKRHERVHTREKPYTCAVCAQKFCHSTSLNKHMQTVHNIPYKWGDYKMQDSKERVTTKSK